jgi:hypothetical protein
MNVATSIAQALFVATLLLSVGIVAATPYWAGEPGYLGLVILGCLGGAAAPRITVGLGLFLLALGGNRPASVHFVASIVFGAALFVGLSLREFFNRRQQTFDSPYAEPLLLSGLAYVLISVLSLVSIPFNHVSDDVRNVVDRSALAASARALLFQNEHTILYSYLSVYLTCLSFFIGLVIFRLCRERPDTARFFLSAIGCGLLGACTIGLFDYYGLISLSSFRPLDPVVNPGGVQFRLQSLFAHSGWFAEYVTLAIPTCLLWLILPAPFWLRTILIVLTVLLGEFVLILTYQRGGWLSYPLTLVAIWAAIYVVRRLETDSVDVWDALRRSALKVIISVPLTLAVSISLLLALQQSGTSLTASETVGRYTERLRDIGRTGDRTAFVAAGFLLGSRHPILGGGSESFAWRFDREVVDPGGAFAGRFDLPLHGSAHNVYAQTFAGKGVLGLLALVSIPLLLIGGALNSIRDHRTLIETKLIALIGACFGCAFLIYGNVQEIFYVQVLQYLFFAVVAVVAANNPPQARRKDQAKAIVLIITLGFSGHLVWEYVTPGYTRTFAREPREFGCFPEEGDGKEPFRWCSQHAVIKIPRPVDGTDHGLVFTAGSSRQDIILSNVNDGSTLESVSLKAGEKKLVRLPHTLFAAAPSEVYLRLDATTSFVPALTPSGSTDRRRLAYRLRHKDIPPVVKRTPSG